VRKFEGDAYSALSKPLRDALRVAEEHTKLTAILGSTKRVSLYDTLRAGARDIQVETKIADATKSAKPKATALNFVGREDESRDPWLEAQERKYYDTLDEMILLNFIGKGVGYPRPQDARQGTQQYRGAQTSGGPRVDLKTMACFYKMKGNGAVCPREADTKGCPYSHDPQVIDGELARAFIKQLATETPAGRLIDRNMEPVVNAVLRLGDLERHCAVRRIQTLAARMPDLQVLASIAMASSEDGYQDDVSFGPAALFDDDT